MKKNRSQNPLSHLLLMVRVLAVDAVLLGITLLADRLLLSDPETGEYFYPSFSFVLGSLLAVVTAILLVVAVARTIGAFVRMTGGEIPAPAEVEPTNSDTSAPARKVNPSALLYLLLGPMMVVVSYAVVLGFSLLETNALPQPEMGFKIPVITLLLIPVFFGITVVTAVVSLVLTVRNIRK